MEPSAAIAMIETQLRSLIRDFSKRDWQNTLGPDRVVALKQRYDEEVRRRRPAIAPSDLLSYTHFYELRTIISKQWEDFAHVLGSKREFEVWSDHVEDWRNAPAHSRELQRYEKALLEGIAGLIGTRVTVARSQRGPDSNHYPLIDSVVDSFGQEAAGLGGLLGATVASSAVLEPGQTVRFRARATDPQGRELSWSLGVLQQLGKQWTHTGPDVELEWTVRDRDVANATYVHINVRSGGKYHRHASGYDDSVTFVYRVDPPSGHVD